MNPIEKLIEKIKELPKQKAADLITTLLSDAFQAGDEKYEFDEWAKGYLNNLEL